MKPRLLVLDDDHNILALLRTYFGGLGWHVEACAEASAGLQLADSDAPFDAVICDLHFTGAHLGEGYEILSRARRRRPHSAVRPLHRGGRRGRSRGGPAARSRRGHRQARAPRPLARRRASCDEEAVSLSGSVEDLPLLEILQVVSFCQKTGHLTVRAPAGEAAVLFESGRVVSGYVWDVPGLPRDQPPEGPARELVLRQRLASVLERLVRLREGDFAFHLTDGVPPTLGGRDLTGETLPYGINPEELMLDLARKLDEDRRDAAAALEASFAAPADDDLVLEELPLEEPPAPPPATGPVVLLLDDEPDIRRVVGERLAAAGFAVSLAASPGMARREMERLAAARTPFLLVADLGLPSESGASFRGGLDVARLAGGLPSPPPVLLMAETFDEKLRSRAKRLGVSLLAFKPGLSKLDPLQYEADLRAFGDKLARDLLPRLEGRRTGAAARPAPPKTLHPGEAAREAVLRSALEEMRRSPDPDLVAFLLLRAARAFFPRVLLFVVKDERLRGLSGFGPADSARQPGPAGARDHRGPRAGLAVQRGGGEREGLDRPAARRRPAARPPRPDRPPGRGRGRHPAGARATRGDRRPLRGRAGRRHAPADRPAGRVRGAGGPGPRRGLPRPQDARPRRLLTSPAA